MIDVGLKEAVVKRLGWSVGVVMLLIGGAVGVVTAGVWVGVITHPDPGNLTRNVAFFTAGWAVWMLIGLMLIRRCR